VAGGGEPFRSAAMWSEGAHVNAVGAMVPTGAESANDVITRCSRIVVDSVGQAKKLSRERDGVDWNRVQPLSQLLVEQPKRAAGEITLFKSLGIGIADLALATEIHRRAVDLG